MNKIKFLFSLIGKRTLAKYLPQILAWATTKGLTYTLERYPEKMHDVIELSDKISTAFKTTTNSVRDGIITVDEIEDIKGDWLKVFKK